MAYVVGDYFNRMKFYDVCCEIKNLNLTLTSSMHTHDKVQKYLADLMYSRLSVICNL
jgi:hypothetical protein